VIPSFLQVFPYELVDQVKACATEGSYGEMRGMKLLGGLECVLLLWEAFICEVIMVMAASPVMHRCPAIMTRDCKSPQPLMYAIQGAMESNLKGRIRLCIICFVVRAQYGSGFLSSGGG
jgi:hypothetical protein